MANARRRSDRRYQGSSVEVHVAGESVTKDEEGLANHVRIRAQCDDVGEHEIKGRPTVTASDDACLFSDLTSTSNLE